VCIEKGSEFYLRKLRRDTVVLVPVEVQKEHRGRTRSSQAIGSLRTYHLKEGLKGYYCRDNTESKRSNTQKYLIDCRKECVQEFFQGLKLQAKAQEG
jgi:hypothetical protein